MPVNLPRQFRYIIPAPLKKQNKAHGLIFHLQTASKVQNSGILCIITPEGSMFIGMDASQKTPPCKTACSRRHHEVHMFGKFIKYGMLPLTALWLAACSSVNKDVVPDKEPEELYMKAYESLAEENYGQAKDYLEAIDSRYPFGPYAHQVQMDLIYTYYKDRENDLAMAEIDKFLRLNPQDPNVDYVLYMRGLTNMQKATNRMLNLLFIDTYDRDISNLEQAFRDFRLLIAKFPKSLYAADAYARMVYIRDTMARHEYAVADFYYRKGAYLSSARRCQYILKNFRDTETLEDALTLLEKNYRNLKLPELADRTKQFKNMNLR